MDGAVLDGGLELGGANGNINESGVGSSTDGGPFGCGSGVPTGSGDADGGLKGIGGGMERRV